MANFTLLLGAFVALHLLFANDPVRARRAEQSLAQLAIAGMHRNIERRQM